MKRRWIVRLAWACLLAPQLGCVALPQAFTPPPASTSASGAEAAKPLPATETAQICLKLGESMAQQGHLVEAIGQYEKARQSNPKLDLSYKLAILYDQQGDYSHSVAEYQRAIAAHPRDANLLNDFGYCHYQRGEWVKAEEALRQAVEIDAKHSRAWTNLGMTLGMQGKVEEARVAFGRVVGPAEVESNIAFLMATQGKRQEAIQGYREAVTLDPNHRLARVALAKLEALPESEPAAAKPPATKASSPQDFHLPTPPVPFVDPPQEKVEVVPPPPPVPQKP